MPNTKDIGDASEAMALASFLRAQITVLLPFGDNKRYDMVLEHEGRFLRVQAKTARRDKRCSDSLIFDTCSSYAHRGRGKKHYRGEIDFFAVYSPELDKLFLVPVADVGKTQGTLRLSPAKNKQTKRLRWARDYEFTGTIPP